MTRHKNLLATCSVLAILAAPSGAQAGNVKITTPQAHGVTIAPGYSYAAITGTTVTGNVTDPGGVTLMPGSALPMVTALAIRQSTITGAVVNAGTLAGLDAQSLLNSDASVAGLSITGGTTAQGLANAGTIAATLTPLPSGVITNSKPDLLNAVGVNVALGPTGMLAGGITNGGSITASLVFPTAPVPVLFSQNYGYRIFSSFNAYATGVKVTGGAHGGFAGGIANSGVIAATGTVPVSFSFSSQGSNPTYVVSDVNTRLRGLGIVLGSSVQGVGQGGSFSGAIANSGTIAASLDASISVSLTQGRIVQNSSVDGLTLTAYGGSIRNGAAVTAAGAGVTSTITNSGLITARVIENATLNALTPQTYLKASPSALGLRLSLGGGAVNGGYGNVTGAHFTGNLINSGTIIASASLTATGTGSGSGDSVSASAIGISLSGGFASAFSFRGNPATGYAGGSRFIGNLVNSGKVIASLDTNTTLNGAFYSQASVYGIRVLAGLSSEPSANHATVTGGTFAGTITNSGTILASLTASQNGTVTAQGNNFDRTIGLDVGATSGGERGHGGTVAGAIINSGTIAATASGSGTAVGSLVDPIHLANGNSYNLTEVIGIHAFVGGNFNLTRGGPVSGSAGLFKGGITNTGQITATANDTARIAGVATGILVRVGIPAGDRTQLALQFSGGLFQGDVVNNGTIMAAVNAQAAGAKASGVTIRGAGGRGTTAKANGAGGTFLGNIINAGLISASASGTAASTDPAIASGIAIAFLHPLAMNGGSAGVGVVMGSVMNSGTVTATASGPHERAFGINIGTALGPSLYTGIFTGAIVNSGVISARGVNGTSGIGIEIVTPVTGGITNSGTITGSDAALDFSHEAGGATTLTQTGGLIAGSILGSGTDTLVQSGGTILLAPGQKITGLGSFTQSGGTLALQVTPTQAPQVTVNTLALHGVVEIIPLLGSGSFAASETFQKVLTTAAPINIAGTHTTSAVTVFDAILVPEANPNVLDIRLQLDPARTAQDLTQSLRFGLEEVSVLHDSIEHRLLDGSAYDGGGIASASLSDPGHQVAGGQGVLNDPASPGGLWARGYGVRGVSSPFEDDRVGLLVGGDWHLADHLVVGLALDYDHTEARFQDAATTKLDAYQGAAYVGWGEGPLYATGLAGAGVNEFSTTRSLGLPGVATSSPGGSTYDLYGEAGYRWKASSLTLTPYLGAGYTHSSLDGFNESGGFGALHVNAGSSQSFAASLGLRVSTVIAGNIVPELRVGYAHEFLDATQSLSGSFATLPFTSTGASFGRDSALVGVGVTQAINGNARIFVDYDGKITGGLQEHAVSAGVRVNF
ncbi:MAG TPA: autotransporter domain-containing protein [Stellaceae bacterium]|nr:autotransporter domain-containing protein [Stellaceae bacterium]